MRVCEREHHRERESERLQGREMLDGEIKCVCLLRASLRAALEPVDICSNVSPFQARPELADAEVSMRISFSDETPRVFGSVRSLPRSQGSDVRHAAIVCPGVRETPTSASWAIPSPLGSNSKRATERVPQKRNANRGDHPRMCGTLLVLTSLGIPPELSGKLFVASLRFLPIGFILISTS